MAFQEGRHLQEPGELGQGMDGLAGVGVECAGIGAARQQPLRALQMVLADGVAEQVIERADLHLAAQRLLADHAPHPGAAVRLAMSPEHVVPMGVLSGDGDVVERLGIVGIGPGPDQQLHQLQGLGVAGLDPFAQADGASQHLEGGAPAVVELEVRIGAGLQQTARDGDGVDWIEPAVGDAGESGPFQRAARPPGAHRIAGETPLDLGELAAGRSGEQAVGGDGRIALQDPAGRHDVAVPAVAQHLVHPLGVALACE